MNAFKELNSSDVDPIYGGVVDIQSEIKLTSNKFIIQ